jgi:hypothetical protein
MDNVMANQAEKQITEDTLINIISAIQLNQLNKTKIVQL